MKTFYTVLGLSNPEAFEYSWSTIEQAYQNVLAEGSAQYTESDVRKAYNFLSGILFFFTLINIHIYFLILDIFKFISSS
jgi:hypothetical protein